MEHIDVYEFQTVCLEALERVRQTGEPLEILSNGQTLAVVYPPPVPAQREAYGALRGSLLEPPGDLVSAVSEEIWEAAKE
jgi:antitoxin (DNA-binding transcriptional repressor) of toxin-antitoxin stability system